MYIIDNAAKLVLTAEQTAEIERLAEETGIDIRGGWEDEAQIRFNAVEATLSGSLIGRLKASKSSLHFHQQSAGCFQVAHSKQCLKWFIKPFLCLNLLCRFPTKFSAILSTPTI